MEDDLKFFQKERRPQTFPKWKTTSIFSKMEDDLIFFQNRRRPQFFSKWGTTRNFSKREDDLKLFQNGRQPQVFQKGRRPQTFTKWKTTSNFSKIEDDLKFSKRVDDLSGRQPQLELTLLDDDNSRRQPLSRQANCSQSLTQLSPSLFGILLCFDFLNNYTEC